MMENFIKTKKIYLVSEVSNYLRLHPHTIRRLALTGKIPAFKVGGQWRFDAKTIEIWKNAGEKMPKYIGEKNKDGKR